MAVRAHQNAVDLVDEAASAFLGVNRTDARCLDILDQRGPMTAGELAQAMGLSTGAVTAVLDRMERAGFARRVRHSHDRRKVVVEITAEARRRAWEVYGPIAEEAFAELSELSDDELVMIRDFLNRGSEFLIEHAGRVRRMTAHIDPVDHSSRAEERA